MLLSRLKESFLLIPGVQLFAAVVLGFLVPKLDPGLDERFGDWINLFAMKPDTAQALLAAIAGALTTVASIVFSTTVVTLSIATNQLGPRLLRTFVKSTTTQVSLGAFVATSLYCLLVLAFLQRDGNMAPRLGIILALLFTIIDLGILVYFTHRIATLIQAPNIVQAVAGDLDNVIDKIYPHPIEDPPRPTIHHEDIEDKVATLGDDYANVNANNEGYIQEIEHQRLIALANKHDLVIHLKRRPGHFLSRDAPLALVWPAKACTKKLAGRINRCITYGNRPTPHQDVEAAVQELVEVGVRALSSGINDPLTAIQCVDRLGATLSRFVRRAVPSPFLTDQAGQLREVTQTILFPDIVEAAFNPIRQFGRGDVPVSIRLLEILALIARNAHRQEDLQAIRDQAQRVMDEFKQAKSESRDARDMHTRFDELCELVQRRENGHDHEHTSV